MKCQKCNRIQKKGEKYCENCGTKFEKEKITVPKLSKKTQICILSIFSTLLILFCGYQIGNYFTSPSWVARTYFEQITNNDIAGIYKTIGKEDSTFYSQSLLKEKMELLENVDTYQILSVEVSGREAFVTFEYYLENDPKAYYANVKLYRNSDRKWLFYDHWKVDSGKVVENVTVKIPKGASVTIDGMDLSSFQNSEKSTDTYDVYQIPTMVAGTYEFNVKMNHDIIATEKIEVSEDAVYTIGKIEFPDTLEEDIESKTLETLRVLYAGSLQNQSFEAIRGSLSNVSNIDNLEKRYISLKRSIQNSMISYTEIDISRVSFLNATYQDGKWLITMTMTHHDVGTYTVLDQSKEYNQTDLKSTVIVSIVDQNDTLQIEDITLGSLR